MSLIFILHCIIGILLAILRISDFELCRLTRRKVFFRGFLISIQKAPAHASCFTPFEAPAHALFAGKCCLCSISGGLHFAALSTWTEIRETLMMKT